MRTHRISTVKAQARYNKTIDRRLLNQVYYPEAGSYVYVRRDNTFASTTGERKSRNLASPADG